ncbi:RecX family transcriptional regulator [Bacteroidales bacterium OttesenSCG-928-M06]|nr:RecX family transcriptional regulator [Bacteroidales bacterium OttesenSCG-928-M06]
MKNISYEKALHLLAAYCSKSERCIADISKKMILWNLSEGDQIKILDRLRHEKFLDEQRFAYAFTHDKATYNKWGYHKIKYELKKKNIPDPIISEALKKINPQQSKETLRYLLNKKIKTTKGKNDYEIKQKLIRFALSRGYFSNDIEEILSSLLK